MKDLKLLMRICWNFSRTTKLEFRELLSEAYIAYYEAMKKYNKNLALPSTFIWKCVTNHLIDFYKKELKHKYIDILEYKNEIKTFQNDYFYELTREQLIILEILLKMSKKFVTLPSEEAIKKIERILQNQGWNKIKIQKTIKQLKLKYEN